eukprot:GHVS01085904.1.p1 GENE.GHVS01085904.1~~GHVS01085904.1.p1  ORF type:complete len:187 (+),score=9.86 GHVS01085904.1:148-708(+)
MGLLRLKVSVTKKEMLVKHMQRLALNFTLVLSQVMNETTTRHGFAGHLKYLLWMHVYDGDPAKRQSPDVHELTVYVLRLYRFAIMLPIDVLYNGDFEFPAWSVAEQSPGEPSQAGVGGRGSRLPLVDVYGPTEVAYPQGYMQEHQLVGGLAKHLDTDGASRIWKGSVTDSTIQGRPVMVRKNPYHD